MVILAVSNKNRPCLLLLHHMQLVPEASGTLSSWGLAMLSMERVCLPGHIFHQPSYPACKFNSWTAGVLASEIRNRDVRCKLAGSTAGFILSLCSCCLHLGVTPCFCITECVAQHAAHFCVHWQAGLLPCACLLWMVSHCTDSLT